MQPLNGSLDHFDPHRMVAASSHAVDVSALSGGHANLARRAEEIVSTVLAVRHLDEASGSVEQSRTVTQVGQLAHALRAPNGHAGRVAPALQGSSGAHKLGARPEAGGCEPERDPFAGER